MQLINKIYKLKLRRITREQCRRVFDIKLKHSFPLFSTRFIGRSKNTLVIQLLFPWFENSIVTCPRDELAVSISRVFRGHSSAWFGYRALRQPETNAVYTRAFDIESEGKKEKKVELGSSSTLVFALRRRHTRAPHLKARPHAPRVINTQVIRECRTDEEDRWAEAWFFLVIKNYAPRPVCVKARGFVNIFRPVCAFGLAKRRDKVSAYFPGSPPLLPWLSPQTPSPLHSYFFLFLPFFRSLFPASVRGALPLLCPTDDNLPWFSTRNSNFLCRQRTTRAHRCGNRPLVAR